MTSIPKLDRESIPKALCEAHRWVLWRYETRDGKRTKVPLQPDGQFARVNDPGTWTSLEDALRALEAGPFDGVGFVLGDGVVGLDLDWKAYTGEGIPPEAQDLINRFQSYAELSPSGRGAHILIYGRLPQGARNRKTLAPGVELEIYGEARYFTFTGEKLNSFDITDQQEVLEAVLGELDMLPKPAPQPVYTLPSPEELEDIALLERMFNSKEGDRIRRLWFGDTSGYRSPSEADLALVRRLVKWTNGDAERVDRLFRKSLLYRTKWDRKRSADGRTYGEMTIQKALEGYKGRHGPAPSFHVREGYEAVRGEPTEKEEWPEPLPLFRPQDEPEPYPLDALGPLLPVVLETKRIIQAPDALIANSFLAASSMAAQGAANVELDGRVYPLSLYLLTVAESGERKTTVDEVATGPIREFQRLYQQGLQEEIHSWLSQMAVWESEKKKILQDKKSRKEKEEALKKLGPPPTRPWWGVLLTTEPTYEGLVKMLAESWPAAGLFSSEGGGFLGGHAMNPDHKLRTLTGLSELWDGKPIDRVRREDGVILLYNRRLALHLMAQPLVARKLLGDPLAHEQGLLARMLVAAPSSTIGGRKYVPEAVEATEAYEDYSKRIKGALEKVELDLRESEDPSHRNGLSFEKLTLTPRAKELWVSFYEHVERHLNGELAPIKAFGAKLPAHAIRLAGVLALMANLRAREVDHEDMEKGIRLAQWYGGEALRLAGGYRVPQKLALAQEVLGWILKRAEGREPKAIGLAEVYRLGPPQVRSARAAREVLEILEEHGYLAYRKGLEIEGKRHKDAWEVNPRALP